MAEEPMKKPINRAEQLKRDSETRRGIKIYDIDLAIIEHMIDNVVPNIEVFNESVKVPVLYGSPERWKSIQKDGYVRDPNGMVQIPLVMIRRNSIDRDESMHNKMNRNLYYPAVSRYSQKHRYDKFSLMTGTERPLERYNITIPDYVTVSYECVIWTDFTEHMNKIVEAFQYATDEYWGDKYGHKFRVKIDSFDTTAEISAGSQRIIKTNFNMLVNAYLLPEKFNNESTIKKAFTPKKVVWGYETDLTGEGGFNFNPSLYNEYADVINFIALRGSKMAEFLTAETMRITNVEVPILPLELRDSFNDSDWFRVYINGVFIPSTKYTYSFNKQLKEVVFTFNTATPVSQTNLGYTLSTTDELSVTGKFIEL